MCVPTPTVLPVTGAWVLSNTLVVAQSVTSSKGDAYLALVGDHGDLPDDEFLVAACPVDLSEPVFGMAGAAKYFVLIRITPGGTCSWRKRIYAASDTNVSIAAVDDGVAIAANFLNDGKLQNAIRTIHPDGSLGWELALPKLAVRLASLPAGILIGGAYLKEGNVGGFDLPTTENGVYFARVEAGVPTLVKTFPATVTGPDTAVYAPWFATRPDGSTVFVMDGHNVSFPTLGINVSSLPSAAEIDPSGTTKWVNQVGAGNGNSGGGYASIVLGDDGTAYFVGEVLNGPFAGDGTNVARRSPLGEWTDTSYPHAHLRSAALVDGALFLGGQFTQSQTLADTSIEPITPNTMNAIVGRMDGCGHGSAAVLGNASIHVDVTTVTPLAKGVLVSGMARGAIGAENPPTCSPATIAVGNTVLPLNGCITTFVAMVAQ